MPKHEEDYTHTHKNKRRRTSKDFMSHKKGLGFYCVAYLFKAGYLGVSFHVNMGITFCLVYIL